MQSNVRSAIAASASSLEATAGDLDALAGSDELRDAHALGVVVLDDEQVAHRALDERRRGIERPRKLLGVGRAREEAGRARAQRRVALAAVRDDVHRDVARARVVLELVEDPGAAADRDRRGR